MLGSFFKREGKLIFFFFSGLGKKKNLNSIIFENNSQESRKMTIKVRNVENGKKWGRLQELPGSGCKGERGQCAAVQETLQLLVGK